MCCEMSATSLNMGWRGGGAILLKARASAR
jgi:hypothetical protein